jgi:hypothetical protein
MLVAALLPLLLLASCCLLSRWGLQRARSRELVRPGGFGHLARAELASRPGLTFPPRFSTHCIAFSKARTSWPCSKERQGKRPSGSRPRLPPSSAARHPKSRASWRPTRPTSRSPYARSIMPKTGSVQELAFPTPAPFSSFTTTSGSTSGFVSSTPMTSKLSTPLPRAQVSLRSRRTPADN